MPASPFDRKPTSGSGSKSKPGLEALIRTEKEAARGLTEVASAAREVTGLLSALGESARASTSAASGRATSAGKAVAGSPAAAGDPGKFAQELKATLGTAGGGGVALNLGKEFDRVGGAIITMFRRVDAAMKFPTVDRAITGIKKRFDDFYGLNKKGAEETGAATKRALEGTVPILAELGGAVAKVKTKYDSAFDSVAAIKAAWEKVKALAAEPDRGPPAGRRPGRGRAVNLVGEGGRKAVGAVDSTVKGAARLAEALVTAGASGVSALNSVAGRGTVVGEIFRGLVGTTVGYARIFSGLIGVTVGVGRGFLRVKNYVSSMGDVAGKTFSTIFREGGMVRGVLGGVAGAAAGVARGLLRVGTLGVFGKAAGEARRFKSAASSSIPVIGNLTSSLRGMAGQVLVAFGAFGAIYKVVEFFKSGVSGAVDLNETVNASKVTFGGFATNVFKYADEMAAKFGLVKNETLSVANGFGDFGTAAGLSGKASSDFSLKMTQLSADLMSFKNIPFEEAAQKIQSALAGEAEPLRRFGVLITEDMVKAKALAMGLDGVTRSSKSGSVELSEQAKVMARAALISDGLFRAQGDLSRTSGDAANQFRKAGGGLTNFATSIGELLMPAVKAGVVAFNEFLSAVVGAFESAKPAIAGFVEKVAKGLEFAGALARNYDLTWQLVVIKFREGVLNMVAVLGVIPDNLAIIGGYVANNFTRLIADAMKYVGNAVANMAMNLGAMGTAFLEWAKNPLGGFQFTWIPFAEGFKATIDTFPELMKPVFTDLSAESAKVWAEFEKREKARKKAMGGAAAAPMGEAPGPLAALSKPAKAAEAKLAGIAEAGSKEAYSAIAKAQVQGRDSDAKRIARNADQQTALQGRIAKGIDALAGRPAPQIPVMTI